MQRENCELSDQETRFVDMGNPAFFENAPEYDFYEKSAIASRNSQECLDGSYIALFLFESNENDDERVGETRFGRFQALDGFYGKCFYSVFMGLCRAYNSFYVILTVYITYS